MIIYRAVLEAQTYRFEAFGNSDADAMRALREGLEQHATHHKLAPDWWRKYLLTIEISDYEVGASYRDGEKL